MRWLLVAALFVSVATAVMTVAHQPFVPETRTTVRVATYNIHKGADRGNVYDLHRTIAAIAAFDADLVGLQEVMRNDAAFACDDQAARIADGLRTATGQPWTYVFVEGWTGESRECQRNGRGDGPAMEGVALFAPGRILAWRWVQLSTWRRGLAAWIAAMPRRPIVVAHLTANGENQPTREREVAALMPWARRLRAAIVMGDLNALPDASEMAPLQSAYRDAWPEAARHNRASGVVSGATRPGRRLARIDYVFYDPDGLTLDAVDVVDTSASSGLTEVSDHRPVIATFRPPPASALAAVR